MPRSAVTSVRSIGRPINSPAPNDTPRGGFSFERFIGRNVSPDRECGNKLSLVGICGLRTTYFGRTMRLLPFVLGIIFVGSIGINTPARAESYPWCAIYSDGAVGGITSCGFTTFEQCSEAAHRVDGFCRLNPRYQSSS
jgi:Protein of unknown function (DUF3551)